MKLYFPLCLAVGALIGCNSNENTSNGMEPHKDLQKASPSGQLIKEFHVGKESVVRFTESSGEVTISLEGHLDEMSANKDLERKLFSATSMEAAYRTVDSIGPIPKSILDYDKRPASEASTKKPAGANGEGPGTTTLEQSSQPLEKTAHHADPSSDAWWDWNADATWWQNVVGWTCGWHTSATYTNVTWADDYRYGWYAKGYLMAASHTYGANAYAYVWNGSSWVLTNSTYLEPRHYIIWSSNDSTKKYRRYRVEGFGGAYARIHWGMRWDTQAPGAVDVICRS